MVSVCICLSFWCIANLQLISVMVMKPDADLPVGPPAALLADQVGAGLFGEFRFLCSFGSEIR